MKWNAPTDFSLPSSLRGSKSGLRLLSSIYPLKPNMLGSWMIVTATTEDPNPFDAADSAAAIEGYVFSEYGEDGLRELLSTVDSDQESLMRDSLELEQIGLSKPAAIVAEFAR